MLKHLILFLLVFGVYTSGAFAQSSKDQAQIRAVLDSVADAWNTHNMDQFASLFTPDADWVNIRGARWVGVDEIKKNHVAVHDRFYSKSRVEFNDVKIKMISRDLAVIHARETMTNTDVPKAAGISDDSQLSLMVVRHGKKWLITNGHNTNVAPPPPTRN